MKTAIDLTQLEGFNHFYIEIFKYLDITDLLKLAQVNHQLYNLISTYSLFWNKLLLEIKNAYYIIFGYCPFSFDSSLSSYRGFIFLKQFIYKDQLIQKNNINLFLIHSHTNFINCLAIATSNNFWSKLNAFFKKIKDSEFSELLKFLTFRSMHDYNNDIDGTFTLDYNIYIGWFYNRRKKSYYVMTKKHGLSCDISFEEFIQILKTLVPEEQRNILFLLTFLHEALK